MSDSIYGFLRDHWQFVIAPIALLAIAIQLRFALSSAPRSSGAGRLLIDIDMLSTAIGKTFAWCIVILTFTTSYEVFARYMFLRPTDWAFDASYILYGMLFMMAGAYALSRNAHVRGDFLYRAWRPRTQATLDLVLYFVFFFPGMLAFIYAGYNYAELSRKMNEHSAASPHGPVVWPFKWIIPIVGSLMVLQGVVEVIRCVMTIRRGEWPQRLHDVEELEKIIMDEEQRKLAAATKAEEAGQTRGDI